MKYIHIIWIGWGFLFCGCKTDGQQATAEQCQFIFDRLVELELSEAGFRDPVVTKRWQKELSTRYQGELTDCIGRFLPSDAMSCVMKAKTSEAVSHECLGD